MCVFVKLESIDGAEVDALEGEGRAVGDVGLDLARDLVLVEPVHDVIAELEGESVTAEIFGPLELEVSLDIGTDTVKVGIGVTDDACGIAGSLVFNVKLPVEERS